MSSPEDFAARMKAARIAAVASLGAGDDDGPSVTLEDSEANLLLAGGPGPQSDPSNPFKSGTSAHSTIADQEHRSQSPKEGEFDTDYVPEQDDDKPIPFTFASLKSAGKKRPNEFAPPERAAKKGKRSIQARVLGVRPNPDKRDGLIKLQELRYLISKCKTETGNPLTVRLTTLRSYMVEIPHHLHITEELVQASRILEDGGLPDIANQRGCRYPHDLIADAGALIHKWEASDFDAYLLRGVDYKSFEAIGSKKVISRKIQDSYPKRPHDYIGQGSLTNGQWWPLQICLIRDGAHGANEGGISGTHGGVAHSVIVSNSGYGNVDNGETVEYCGTASRTLTATPNTLMLLESHKQRTPVRLFRSGAGKPATYLPKKGLRYDGLYNVTAYTVLDAGTAMHRFTLTRQPGQPPIRYTGVGARPTDKELEVWRNLRKEFGLPA